MSGADALRTSIAIAIGDSMGDHDDYEPGEFSPEAIAVMAVLSDPVHRLAILDAMNLDVREGHYWGQPCIAVLPRGVVE